MINGTYPRLETIVVPPDVREEYIGKYVTEQAAIIINEVGRATMNSKSISLRPLNERLFLLSFETNVPFNSKAEGIQLRVPYEGERGAVEEVRVAEGNKGRLGKANPLGGKRQ